MANADDFRPGDRTPDDPQFLQKKIDELTQKIAAKEKEIGEKDRLLEAYWNTIQSMRIVNRIKRLVPSWKFKRNIATGNFKRANANTFLKRKKGIKICIKIPVYNWKVADTWGDYYFSLGIRKQLIKLGYDVIIQTLDEWYNGKDSDCQVVLVLRGLSKYEPRSKALHLMWNISHPMKVTVDEYNSYDHVFIASQLWTEEIRSSIGNKVSCLLQCTDPQLFKRPLFPVTSEILFIGNSKGIFRPVIKNLLPTDFDLKIYGHDWENIIDSKYLKGKFIAHNKLYRYYGGAKILLNDHWDDMRRYGFISNRIFDALACGAFIISDHVEGMDEILNDSLVTYVSSDDLKEKVNFYLKNSNERKKNSKKGHMLIVQNHTFELRAREIDRVIGESLNKK